MGTIRQRRSSVILLAIICSCRAIMLEPVYWNSSNTKFTPGQGLVLYPQIGDRMDIVCPWASASSGGKEEFYRLYMVTRSQMESCTIDKTDTPLLNCDRPHSNVKFTFKYQEFSPNIWGLEFVKGRDYYITSMSTGALRGLDNTNGGVCRTKSMKLVLRVGQRWSFCSAHPVNTEVWTRLGLDICGHETRLDIIQEGPADFDFDIKTDSETEQTSPGGSGGSDRKLFVWIISGCVILIMTIITLLGLLWRYQQSQQPTSVSLNTSAVPKRGSTSSNYNGSDRSDVFFPLRASDSMICHHYDRVSFDYGAPMHIVQEISPHSPIDIYYKV